MNEIEFSSGIIEAVERGREKIRIEQERIEAETRELEEKNEKKWQEYYQQARELLPEAVRMFLIRDDQRTIPPSHFTNITWKLDIWGFAPIFVELDLNNQPEYVVAELDEIIDGDLVWSLNWRRAKYYLDLDIALATAYERYQEAKRHLESYKTPASPVEPEYVPIQDDPIILNPPLLSELTEFIRGLIDERLDDRGY